MVEWGLCIKVSSLGQGWKCLISEWWIIWRFVHKVKVGQCRSVGGHFLHASFSTLRIFSEIERVILLANPKQFSRNL